MIDPLFQLILSWCLAVLFIGAAVDKLLDWGTFRTTLEEFRLMPEWALAAVGSIIVLMEALAGLGLLFSSLRAIGAGIAVTLLLAYGAGIWINLLRGRVHIDCGCLGGRESALSYWLVLRNATLTAAAVLCVLTPSARTLSWMDIVSATGGVVTLVLLYLGINLLLSYHLEQSAWGLTDD